MRNRYRLPFTTTALGVLSTFVVTTAIGLLGKEVAVKVEAKKTAAVKNFSVMDGVLAERVKFAADHGVADPISLVAAVRYSSLAHLLISVAIEESRGNPVAVGSSGERGAWQVKASSWGTVPVDIYGQAWQAETIIRGLLVHTKGNKKKALARYNGGSTPPGKSYRYAERILKRVQHLQASVTSLPNYAPLREVLLDLSEKSLHEIFPRVM